MKISKAGGGCSSVGSAGELAAINSFAKTELTDEEVYTFSVVLCDNEVDRDCERFSEKALEELAALFVGRTGIFDHEWKAANQTARIYRTELLREKGRLNSLGEQYVALKGFAYMLRSEKNEELIAEIDAGIKKETSIGCAAARRCCSVCGAEGGGCGHIKGREYGGSLCYHELSEITDAYEWSFVAVPAQRAAGVTKGFGKTASSLKAFVLTEAGSPFAQELEALEKEAALGREFKDGLQSEVLRLALLCDRGLYEALGKSSSLMSAAELKALKQVFEDRLSERLPIKTQLPGRGETASLVGEEYLV